MPKTIDLRISTASLLPPIGSVVSFTANGELIKGKLIGFSDNGTGWMELNLEVINVQESPIKGFSGAKVS